MQRTIDPRYSTSDFIALLCNGSDSGYLRANPNDDVRKKENDDEDSNINAPYWRRVTGSGVMPLSGEAGSTALRNHHSVRVAETFLF